MSSLLINANALHIPLASGSVHTCEVCYNSECLDEQIPGRFVLEAAAISQFGIVGKAPSISGIRPGCSSRQRQRASGGRFAMRNEKGQFVDGSHGIATRFKKGEHWREHKPYWDRDWLYNEYVTKQRSAAEIAADWGVDRNAIHFWLTKLGIPARNTSEARKIKHWGASGSDNPMFGKTGEDNPNWRGGVTPERQAVYASADWKSATKIVWRRDRGTCQRCGKKGYRRGAKLFHIHHVRPFAIVEARTDPSNLILLCNDCHNWVHSSANTNKEFIKNV
jgi:hypothetical protein